MSCRAIYTVNFLVFMVGLASIAFAQGVPDLNNCWVVAEGIEPGDIAVSFNLPDGEMEGGNPLTAARTLGGPVDASITLFLRDSQNNPIVGFPRGIIELVDPTNQLAGCYTSNQPNSPEADSDSEGKMVWSSSLSFGGWIQDEIMVSIWNVGEMLCDVPIHHNSADINADWGVNLADVAIFAEDFFGEYTFRSDFYYDGIINLIDVAMMGQAFGAACP